MQTLARIGMRHTFRARRSIFSSDFDTALARCEGRFFYGRRVKKAGAVRTFRRGASPACQARAGLKWGA